MAVAPVDVTAQPTPLPTVVRPAPTLTVARGALALLSTQPLTWGSSMLLAAFVPRLLGDEALGYFSVLMTLSSLVGTVASLGIPDYLVRLVATRPERAMVHAGSALAL